MMASGFIAHFVSPGMRVALRRDSTVFQFFLFALVGCFLGKGFAIAVLLVFVVAICLQFDEVCFQRNLCSCLLTGLFFGCFGMIHVCFFCPGKDKRVTGRYVLSEMGDPKWMQIK
jgi:hypothetical protein